MNKAKQLLIGQARTLRSKAEQKRKDAYKLELEAEQLLDDAAKL